MPKAGKKHFPYTKAGKKRAKAYAKKHGLKVKGSKNPGYVPEESKWNTYRSIGKLIQEIKGVAWGGAGQTGHMSTERVEAAAADKTRRLKAIRRVRREQQRVSKASDDGGNG